MKISFSIYVDRRTGGLGVSWWVEQRFPHGFYSLDIGPLSITMYINTRSSKEEPS